MTPLVVSVPSDQLAHDIRPLPDDVEVVVWDLVGPAPRERFDLVVAPYLSDPSVLSQLADLLGDELKTTLLARATSTDEFIKQFKQS